MIRFVGNDADGRPLKRKQSQKACERCRKRKKRCTHRSAIDNLELDAEGALRDTSSVSRFNATRHLTEGLYRSPPEPLHENNDIDDNERRPSIQILSPATAESTISAAVASNSADTVEEDHDRDPRFIGDLNPEGIFVARGSTADAATATAAASLEDVIGVWAPRRSVNAARAIPGLILPDLQPYLEDACCRALPGPTDYDALYQLYIENIHSILPIVNLEACQRQPYKPRLLLKLAICLITSGHAKASKYLRQCPKNFTAQITQLLRAAIDNGLTHDKQIIMQVLGILAISTQLSDDRHSSAEFASRMITYAQTAAFHHDTTTRSDNVYITRLFCCVFALDRLNAAIQGRPVLMHERDFGRDLNSCISQQESLFQLLLRVILLLDKVIQLYRPSPSSNDNSTESSRNFSLDFPTFEDLLSMCGTMRAPAALVATVETLYHAVAMLSYRSQSLSELSRNSASHTRQSLSAASIMSIAGSEFRGQLSVLPFVAYAISLALRVTYRDLRLSKSAFTRTRARRQLLHTCALLRELGEMYPSSLQMADLAEQTVREMDKACTTVATQRRQSVVLASDEMNPPETQQDEPTRRDQDSPEGAVGRHVVMHTEAPMVTHGVNLADDYDMFAFDPGQFDFDLDIFDHFDPDFDIQAIDAALANSIDPSLPISTID